MVVAMPCISHSAESVPVTNATMCGGAPCATLASGVSLPEMKTGTILSNTLIRCVSNGSRTPVGTTFVAIQYSISALPTQWQHQADDLPER